MTERQSLDLEVMQRARLQSVQQSACHPGPQPSARADIEMFRYSVPVQVRRLSVLYFRRASSPRWRAADESAAPSRHRFQLSHNTRMGNSGADHVTNVTRRLVASRHVASTYRSWVELHLVIGRRLRLPVVALDSGRGFSCVQICWLSRD